MAAAAPDGKDEPTFIANEVQKKVFTKWINSKLQNSSQSVNDIYTELRDGKILLKLIELLTETSSTPLSEKAEPTEADGADIVRRVVQLVDQHCGASAVSNISSDDIVRGDGSAVRSLVWSIIEYWHVKASLRNSFKVTTAIDAEKVLLSWCRQQTASYRGVDVVNFTTSWSDGLAFNALLHRHHSDWFDYETLIGKRSRDNLEHAFHLAKDRLNVARLLDSDDLEADHLDKKSVLTYVASYYQALQPDTAGLRAVVSPEIPDTRDLVPSSTGSQSSLISSASTVDIAVFNESLDKILAWLRDATDSVSKQSPIADNIDTLKEQFHQHEDFMMSLTQKQTSVGNALHDGNCLVQQPELSDEDRRAVDAQLTLLSNQWEELRLLAMDRQARLQHALMDLQQQQLDQLADWLNVMESRIKSYSAVGGDENIINQQLKEHQSLQLEVEQEQEKVNSLHGMVVVVDESNAESAYAAMEAQLEGLGTRWTSICHWVEDRGALLAEAASKWQTFSKRLQGFTAWLTDTEDVLVSIERRWSADQETLIDMNDIADQVQCLKAIEADMDVMIKYFDELNDVGIQMVQHMDDDNAAIHSINTQLQECQERWDGVVQRMELCSKQIANSGVELAVSVAPSGSQTVTVSKSGAETVSFSLSGSLTSADIKRPRLEPLANYKKEKSTDCDSALIPLLCVHG